MEQESSETAATTVSTADETATPDHLVTLKAEPMTDVTAECSVTLDLD